MRRLVGRSEQFVAKWWQKDEREIPRPWGVHEPRGRNHVCSVSQFREYQIQVQALRLLRFVVST